MKSSMHAQSATSLPRAPRDAIEARSVRYLITMGIRVACFVLMVAITPYGWYTWVLGAAAIFLPYIAVVIANVGSDAEEAPENPERALAAGRSATVDSAASEAPSIIQLRETPPAAPVRQPDEPA